MKTFFKLLIIATIAILPVCFSSASAAVRFNVDVLWNPDPDDAAQVFLHVSNEAFPMPRERVTTVFHEIPDPYNDYPVLAFMAYQAHVDISTVWSYRKKGHNWVNIMFHFGVPPSALFVELAEAPGPPYGNAYGSWRKHGNKMGPDHLTSDDIRFWVRMHALARYGSVPPRQVYQWRQSGQHFDTIAVREYHEKRGNGTGMGRGKSKGRDHHDEHEEKDHDRH